MVMIRNIRKSVENNRVTNEERRLENFDTHKTLKAGGREETSAYLTDELL